MTNVSLPPEYWGSSLWKMMYSIAYTYPDTPNLKEIEAANHWYSALAVLMPCDDCRDHYQELIVEFPVNQYTKTQSKLFEWLEIVSNKINARLEKPAFNSKALYSQLDALAIKPEPTPPATPAPAPAKLQLGPQAKARLRPQRARLLSKTTVKAPTPAPAPKKKPCNCGKRKKTI